MPEVKKTNRFVRLLIVALCLFIAMLILSKFYVFPPLGQLNAGVLTLLGLLVILVLSESFDNFSLGKLMTLSREVEKKTEEVKTVKNENLELRIQMVSMVTSVSQQQSNANFFGFPDNYAKMFKVDKATEEELEEKAEEEEKASEEQPSKRPIKRINHRRLDEKVMKKFSEERNLQEFRLMQQVKLSSHFEAVDPISTITPIFDAYIPSTESDEFIEIKTIGRWLSPMIRDRLYFMLSKLYHYSSMKKKRAFLTLVLVKLYNSENNDNRPLRLFEEFQPAISNGLLNIQTIELSEAETNELYE